jgi:galactokinase
MTHVSDSTTTASISPGVLQQAIKAFPLSKGTVVTTRSPGVIDVMGGIGEDSGSLVLTATLGVACTASLWQSDDDHVRVRLATQVGTHEMQDAAIPVAAFDPSSASPEAIHAAIGETAVQAALPACLTLRQAIADGLVPSLGRGLVVLLQSDFPPDADLGEPWAQAVATLEGLCRLFDVSADRLRKSRICADAVEPLTGAFKLRAPVTSLCGSPSGGLLQLRFHPQFICQPLELPPGISVLVARTQLARPTTRQRLMDTRMCAEMGSRMIFELRQADGMNPEGATDRLAGITPAEYVERYRDRLPPRITGKAFVARFGSLRGLNGELDPDTKYKIRSRAEHHIYENRRVHEFATCIARARRNGSSDPLVQAGDLMYASHWSHSQRCGIGGVEADQLVSAVRSHGPSQGLFGAKVTGGGEGGEVVILMRDDLRGQDALAQAIATAEAASKRRIATHAGSSPGAESVPSPL